MVRLDIGRSISDSLGIIKGNPVVLVPIVVAAAVTTLFYDYIRRVEAGFEVYLYLLLLSLVMAFFMCLVIRIVYDATRGEASLPGGATVAGMKYPVFLVASLLVGLIGGLGFIALIIPGIFLGIKLFYYDCAILIEDAGIIGSLKRSWQVVRGNWWRTFGLHLIFMLPISLLFIIAEFVPAPGTQIIDFVAALGLGWFYAAFTVAFLQLAAGVPPSIDAEPVEGRGQDSG